MASAMLSRRSLLRAGIGAGALAGLGPLLAACGGSGGGKALPAGPPADLHGVTIRAMVNQPHVLAFTQLLGPAFATQFGGTLQVSAVPYDQLTSQQILDVQGGAGQFDVFDYFYFGLGVLVDAGALVDLTDYIAGNAALDVADYLPSIYDPYTLLNGRRYGCRSTATPTSSTSTGRSSTGTGWPRRTPGTTTTWPPARSPSAAAARCTGRSSRASRCR